MAGFLLGPRTTKVKKPSSLTIHLSLPRCVLWHLFPFKSSLDVHFILQSEANMNGFESSLVVLSLMGQQGTTFKMAVLRTSNEALRYGKQVLQTSRGDASKPNHFLSTPLKSHKKNHAISVVLEKHSYLRFCQSKHFGCGRPLWKVQLGLSSLWGIVKGLSLVPSTWPCKSLVGKL